MTLKDVSNGPDWIIWIVGILFAIISIILIRVFVNQIMKSEYNFHFIQDTLMEMEKMQLRK